MTEDDRLADLWLRSTGCYAVALSRRNIDGHRMIKIIRDHSRGTGFEEAFWCYDKAQAVTMRAHIRGVIPVAWRQGERYVCTVEDIIELAFNTVRAPCRPIRHERMISAARKAVHGATTTADDAGGHFKVTFGDKWQHSRFRKRLIRRMVIYSAKGFRRYAFDIVESSNEPSTKG